MSVLPAGCLSYHPSIFCRHKLSHSTRTETWNIQKIIAWRLHLHFHRKYIPLGPVYGVQAVFLLHCIPSQHKDEARAWQTPSVPSCSGFWVFVRCYSPSTGYGGKQCNHILSPAFSRPCFFQNFSN